MSSLYRFCHANQTHFHMKGFTLALVLKQNITQFNQFFSVIVLQDHLLFVLVSEYVNITICRGHCTVARRYKHFFPRGENNRKQKSYLQATVYFILHYIEKMTACTNSRSEKAGNDVINNLNSEDVENTYMCLYMCFPVKHSRLYNKCI